MLIWISEGCTLSLIKPRSGAVHSMSVSATPEKAAGDRPSRRLTVSATFTADPLRESLEFWMAELELPLAVEFAPYDQVFQQLLDPGSDVSRNRDGVNVVLVRLEDWIRARPGGEGPEGLEVFLRRNAADLIDAARGATTQSSAPLIVGLCPDSPAAR